MKYRFETTLLWAGLVLMVAAIVGCGGKQSLAHLSAGELFEIGKEQHDNNKFIKAIETFQTIVYNYPGERIVDTAQYYLALSYYGNEEYELAQVEFNRLVINYPSSAYFESAIFMKAACFFEGTPNHYGLDQSDLEIAIKQFEDYLIDYPESDLYPQAQQMLLVARSRMARKYYESGIVYSRLGAAGSAEMYFQKVVDDYTDTEYGALAVFQCAEMNFLMKQYDKSRQEFESFKAVFPEHELAEKAAERAVESAFKEGEKALKEGDREAAKEKFETFLTLYPDSDRAADVNKYLKEITGTNSSGS